MRQRPPGTIATDDVAADADVVDDGFEDVVLAGLPPSRRARHAEEIAQVVLSDPTTGDRLRGLVRRAADETEAETGQLSIISTRQIALVVEKGVRRRPGTIAATDGLVSPFHDTLCAVSVRADAAVVIADTTADERVASLPAVEAGIIGSYLGYPIHTPSGDVLGVVCVYNRAAHDWRPDDVVNLSTLADQVGRELEAVAAANGVTA